MKIIGPIAGIGSRLRPFTLSKPKTFITVAGSTVLDHIILKLSKSFSSDTELILIVGYKKRQVINRVKKYYDDKFKLTFIEQVPLGYKNNVPHYRGLGAAIYLASKRFKKIKFENKKEDKRNGSFIFLGDMILLDEYSYLLDEYYNSDLDGIIAIMKVPKEDASSYGIVVADEGGIIQKLIEKPENYISNLAIAGIYVFSHSATQAFFKSIKKYIDQRTEESGEVSMTPSMQDLVNQGFKIATVELKKGILDFGRPSNLLNGNRYLLEHESTKVEDFQDLNIEIESSFIKTPVCIGKNTRIFNSVIGPHVSIGKNSIIKNSIIENCVIEKTTTLINIITENSIIGSNVSVENISKNDLIIGDKTSV